MCIQYTALYMGRCAGNVVHTYIYSYVYACSHTDMPAFGAQGGGAVVGMIA